MHRFCERCERLITDGNLWCPEKDCPAESGYPILSYGDCLGDLKVTKLLRVWRTAALYSALRGETPVLLKVAHEHEDAEERLKREAVALQGLNRKAGRGSRWLPAPRSLLPVILPPYPVAAKRPYGEISFRGETKYFAVFEHAQGKFLSDLMLENPQIWHYQAAWVVAALTQAMRPLVAQSRAHLCLTPDMVLVDTDRDGNLRPLLLDLGFLVTGEELGRFLDWPRLMEPGYTAPELLGGRADAATPAADVYSLGMILFELLAGKPGFAKKELRDGDVRDAVLQLRAGLSVERPELKAAGVETVVEQAIGRQSRYNNVVELGKALMGIYGEPPRERRPVPTRTYVLIVILALLLLVVLGVVAVLIVSALA